MLTQPHCSNIQDYFIPWYFWTNRNQLHLGKAQNMKWLRWQWSTFFIGKWLVSRQRRAYKIVTYMQKSLSKFGYKPDRNQGTPKISLVKSAGTAHKKSWISQTYNLIWYEKTTLGSKLLMEMITFLLSGHGIMQLVLVGKSGSRQESCLEGWSLW